MAKGAFNVSTGMDVSAVLNVRLAEDLCEFVMTIAEDEAILNILKDYELFADGVLPEIFAFATQLRKQAKIAQEFKAGRKQVNREVA